MPRLESRRFRVAPPPLTRTSSKALLAVACAVALVAAAVGCGDEQSRGGTVPGDTLTIFSSLPLQGPHAEQAQSIVNAQKLALRDAGGKAGDFKVNFASARRRDRRRRPGRLGSRTRRPRTRARRSRTRARSPTSASFDSGATAISLPITNEAGFVQVSPASTAVGLTKLVPGARRRASPTSSTPPGTARSRASCRPTTCRPRRRRAGPGSSAPGRVFLLGDKSARGRRPRGAVSGRRPGKQACGSWAASGWTRAPTTTATSRATSPRARPDAVYFGGGAESNAVQLWRDLHDALPERALMAAPTTCWCPSSTGGSAPPARAPTSPRPRRTRASCPPAGSASCATTAASSASRPTRSRPTGTRRCRCCSTRSTAPATRRTSATAWSRRCFDTRLRQRRRDVLDRRQRRHVAGPRSPATACATAGLGSRRRCAGDRSARHRRRVRRQALGAAGLRRPRAWRPSADGVAARDAGAARLVRDGRGDRLRHATVEDARDDVVLGQLRVGESPRRSPYAAASFISSVIAVARASSAPRKSPGKHSTLLIWFG